MEMACLNGEMLISILLYPVPMVYIVHISFLFLFFGLLIFFFFPKWHKQISQHWNVLVTENCING